jgi:protein-tyrosine phosphatase
MEKQMNHHLNDQRQLHWEGCLNVRDLGGLPAANGRTTAWQAVIRADTLGRLTPAGQQALRDYGVGSIIDLRAPSEVQKYPTVYSRQPDADGPAYLNLPLESYQPHVSALISKATSRGEVYCIILDHYAAEMAHVLRAIMAAPPGAIVIHCHSGTDRTGMVAALLLSLAGVPADIIAADYGQSRLHLHAYYEKIAAEAGGADKVSSFWGRPTATEAMMTMMLDHIATRYGNTAAYLDKSGLSAQEIEQVRQRLWTP